MGVINQALRELVASASEHAARYNDGEDHTVAAALLTASGSHVLGLNAFHFLGGPCGEVAALAAHAATCPDDPVVAVVAVHGPTGNVIAPCGKCRQVLFDVEPDIQCVVRGERWFGGADRCGSSPKCIRLACVGCGAVPVYVGRLRGSDP